MRARVPISHLRPVPSEVAVSRAGAARVPGTANSSIRGCAHAFTWAEAPFRGVSNGARARARDAIRTHPELGGPADTAHGKVERSIDEDFFLFLFLFCG